jgi:hypothetical protein
MTPLDPPDIPVEGEGPDGHYTKQEWEAKRRYYRIRSIAIYITAICAACALVTSSVGVAIILSNSHTSRSLLHTIKDCTDPKGECAKRSQQATAGVVQNILSGNKEVVIDSIICAKKFPTPLQQQDIPLVLACINARLKADAVGN